MSMLITVTHYYMYHKMVCNHPGGDNQTKRGVIFRVINLLLRPIRFTKAKYFNSALLFTTFLLAIAILAGCRRDRLLDTKKPVTLTMWHNFGGEMQTTMDKLIDEFNSTIGKEKGIIINVTAISSSKELQEKLDMIADGDPGAPELPDIFTAYPKTALQFQSKNLLVNFDNYFKEEELAKYIPAFVEEGRFGDNGLYVFPFAKSTEIMYLNRTLFDRFSAETNVTIENLSTIEGIVSTSMKYYDWTDDQTPDIKNDGKMFFAADSWFNFVQTALKQQGDELFHDNKIDLEQEAYTKLWQLIYPAAVKGGIAIYDGYSSDLSKTGDLVCSVGSSAGIIFYGDTITYPDNVVEKVEYNILPYPVMNEGQKVAIQRGNGLCVAKSTNAKEYAASVFIKWFTDPDQNMRFIASTGYLPVTKEAFQDKLKSEITNAKDARIKEMLKVSVNMYNEYQFFTPPIFEQFDAIGKEYEKCFKDKLTADRKSYLNNPDADLYTGTGQFIIEGDDSD